MKRPVLGHLIDEAFEEFKKSHSYDYLVKPLKDKIGYPDNYVRRIFDEAFLMGRVSKVNHNLTTGELIRKQLGYDPIKIEKSKSFNLPQGTPLRPSQQLSDTNIIQKGSINESSLETFI